MPLMIQGSGVGLAPSNVTVISTSVGLFDDLGFDIGFIQSISPSFDRATVKVRHLNKADAGRVIEQQPGVENYTMGVTSMALYEKNDTNQQSLLNRLPSDISGAGAFKCL